MNTDKNSYTLIYATVMVVIVALMLALVSNLLKDKQTANVELDKKKQLLSSLNITVEGDNAVALYDQYIVQELIVNSKGEILSQEKGDAFKVDYVKEMSKKLEDRQLPLYIAEIDGAKKYIVTLRGAGLWGPLWGYLALNEDKNSVYGVYFSHASETPGLGAEISHHEFQHMFVGKHILNQNGEFVSIAVMKAGNVARGQDQVDAISGGTITSKGVEDMLFKCIGQYEAYLKQLNGGTEE